MQLFDIINTIVMRAKISFNVANVQIAKANWEANWEASLGSTIRNN